MLVSTVVSRGGATETEADAEMETRADAAGEGKGERSPDPQRGSRKTCIHDVSQEKYSNGGDL